MQINFIKPQSTLRMWKTSVSPFFLFPDYHYIYMCVCVCVFFLSLSPQFRQKVILKCLNPDSANRIFSELLCCLDKQPPIQPSFLISILFLSSSVLPWVHRGPVTQVTHHLGILRGHYLRAPASPGGQVTFAGGLSKAVICFFGKEPNSIFSASQLFLFSICLLLI